MGNKKITDFPYYGIGTTALEHFLIYLIKFKKGLLEEQRNKLLSKVRKCCTIKYIKDGTMRNRLLKGIRAIGAPEPQKYFSAYVRRNIRRAKHGKS